MDIEKGGYAIDCDPYSKDPTESSFTFITIDKVVKSYLRHRPIIDYQAEAARIAQYYGAGMWIEEKADCYFDQDALKRRLEELEPIEDAEVISIETVRRT